MFRADVTFSSSGQFAVSGTASFIFGLDPGVRDFIPLNSLEIDLASPSSGSFDTSNSVGGVFIDSNGSLQSVRVGGQGFGGAGGVATRTDDWKASLFFPTNQQTISYAETSLLGIQLPGSPSVSVSLTPIAVPEPSSTALFALGFVGLVSRRRKRCMVTMR